MLEDGLVDICSEDRAGVGADPEHPVAVPLICHNRRAKGAGRVDAAHE